MDPQPRPPADPDPTVDADLVELRDAADRTPSGRRRSRLSLVGTLGLLVGIVACVGTWVALPLPARAGPREIGAAGAALGLLALLWSLARGRTGSGVPVLAILVSGAAVAVGQYRIAPKDPGTPGGWVKRQVERFTPGNQPAPQPPPAEPAPPPIAAQPRPTDPSTGGPSTPVPGVAGGGTLTPDEPPDRSSLFDLPGGKVPLKPVAPHEAVINPPAGGTPAGTPAAPGSPGASPRSPAALKDVPVLRMTPEYKAAVAARDAAQARLRGAELVAQSRLASTPAYQSARAAVDQASAEVDRITKKLDAYAPDRNAAVERRTRAQEQLAKVTADHVASDAGVTAAKRDLAAAEAKLRAAYAEATKPQR